ncbi:MAG TPA: FAD-binding oxidoreductase [Jatrophihabitans sp.]|nr:FAD-binding oxidoreductase [Jatrophihabitans sp.]
MTDLELLTSDVAALRARVDGQVLRPGDRDYEEAGQIWNGARQTRPAVVVRCTRTADVMAALDFARSAGLPIAVRGGGYSPGGLSSCDGLVIDLRPMRSVTVDPLANVAVVAAGTTWGALDAATQRFGYAIPGVPGSHIGVAGSTIGGGFGHLRRAYGLACDNLIGANLVTAQGELLASSGDLNPELLWGLRGGGGNFGVVTSLRFRLRPLPEPVLSGPVVFGASHAGALLRFYRDYTAKLREDITTRLALLSAPRVPGAPRAGHPVRAVPVVAIAAACVGHPIDSERLVSPIRSAAPVLVDRLVAQPYVRLQAAADEVYPPGRGAAVDSWYVDELDDALIDGLRDAHTAMPRGSFEIQVLHMGGAVGRVPRMSTAVPNRAARYLVVAMTRWDDPNDAPAAQDWLRSVDELVQGFAVGGPHVGLHTRDASSVDAYGAERYLRLAALKRRYDPDNVFACNQNVLPLP